MVLAVGTTWWVIGLSLVRRSVHPLLLEIAWWVIGSLWLVALLGLICSRLVIPLRLDLCCYCLSRSHCLHLTLYTQCHRFKLLCQGIYGVLFDFLGLYCDSSWLCRNNCSSYCLDRWYNWWFKEVIVVVLYVNASFFVEEVSHVIKLLLFLLVMFHLLELLIRFGNL